ncbi:MAG: aspartate/glutamate racemase family protein [Pseudomonadota bacterium]
MRILLLNANTSEFVTQRVTVHARQAARPGTEIVAASASFGARIIGTRTELAIAEHATLDALARHAPGCDAVVLAVSYDTALNAAREMLDIPVVGITEAAIATASMLGTRVGVIMFGPRVLALYQENAMLRGQHTRIAGWRALESSAPYGDGPQTEVDQMVVDAAHDLIDRDGCEAVVLAGAVMAGVPQRLQAHVPVPLLEGISCGVAHAEMLVHLACPKATRGSLSRLPARELVGVGEALAARFGIA